MLHCLKHDVQGLWLQIRGTAVSVTRLCSEEEEKRGGPHDQCREGERETETEGVSQLHSVFSAEELESSLAASGETQTRYVPSCLVQVSKVMPVIMPDTVSYSHESIFSIISLLC